MLDDYRSSPQTSDGSELSVWQDCILKNAHLLRRGTKEWPTNKILLQIATEYGDSTNITLAAENYIKANSNQDNSILLRLRNRRGESFKKGLVSTVEFEQVYCSDFTVIDSSRIFLHGGGQLFILDILSGSVREIINSAMDDMLILDDEFYLTWDCDGNIKLRSLISDEVIFVCHSTSKKSVSYIEKLDDARIFIGVKDRLIIYNYKSKLIEIELHLTNPVDGISFSGENLIFIWQSKEDAPFILELDSGKTKKIKNDFESAYLDGAVFINHDVVVYWALGDICFHNISNDSIHYATIDDDESEECSLNDAWLHVRSHPTKAEVLVSSALKIQHYSSVGDLISEVYPPNNFRDFAICEDGSFVTWGGLGSEDGCWHSGSENYKIILDTECVKNYKFLDWLSAEGKLVIVGSNGIPQVIDEPEYVDSLKGVVEDLGEGKIILFQPYECRLTIWDLHLLIEESDEVNFNPEINCPWLTRQGRVAFLNEEGDVSIFAINQAKIEFTLYGLSSIPTELIIGMENILALTKDGIVYLYDHSGVLLSHYHVGKIRGAYPIVNNNIIIWDSIKISILGNGSVAPRYCLGMDNYLEDEPIKGLTVSSCGKVIAAWDSIGKFYFWSDSYEVPFKTISVEKFINGVVCQINIGFLKDELVMAVQITSGFVIVVDVMQEKIIASGDFSDNPIVSLQTLDNELTVTFSSGVIWQPINNKETSLFENISIQIDGRKVKVCTKENYSEWHTNSDVDWVKQLGSKELLVVQSGQGNILSLIDCVG
jgi:hypothetical protein